MPLGFRGMRGPIAKPVWPFSSTGAIQGLRTFSTSSRNKNKDDKDSKSADTPHLTHLDSTGSISMVDVSDKAPTLRSATARCKIYLTPLAHNLVRSNGLKKGDVISVAKIAGIMAAKRTWDVIPLCHPISDMGKISVDIDLDPPGLPCTTRVPIAIEATVRCRGPTGVEMEALHACSVAALTFYDMCKAVDKGMVIEGLRVVEKKGGKSGDWKRE